MDFFHTRKKLEVLVILQGFVRWQDKGQSLTEIGYSYFTTNKIILVTNHITVKLNKFLPQVSQLSHSQSMTLFYGYSASDIST